VPLLLRILLTVGTFYNNLVPFLKRMGMNPGCTLDVCAFYWSMLAAVISFIGLLLRYIMQAPPARQDHDVQQFLASKTRNLSLKLGRKNAKFTEKGDDDGGSSASY